MAWEKQVMSEIKCVGDSLFPSWLICKFRKSSWKENAVITCQGRFSPQSSPNLQNSVSVEHWVSVSELLNCY